MSGAGVEQHDDGVAAAEAAWERKRAHRAALIAQRPGHQLVIGKDRGGVRWFLDGKPVYCGTGLEVLVFDRYVEDHVLEDTVPDLRSARWMHVRLEFTDGCRRAVAYHGVPGIELSGDVDEEARFRWPEGRR